MTNEILKLPRRQTKWTIKVHGEPSEVELIEPHDYGRTSITYKAHSGNMIRAVKCIRRKVPFLKTFARRNIRYPSTVIPAALNEINHEIQYLKFCQNNFVVELMDSGILDRDAWLAMEFCEYAAYQIIGSMKRDPRLNTAVLMHFTAGYLCAIEEINKAGYIHLNIKPGHLLVNSKGVPKLCDFRIASKMEENHISIDSESSFFVAPEVVRKDNIDERADIFSLAVCILILYNHCDQQELFGDRDWQTMVKLYTEEKHSTKEQFEDIISEAVSLYGREDEQYSLWIKFIPVLTRMFSIDVEGRITAKEVLALEPFKELSDDWTKFFECGTGGERFEYIHGNVGRLFGKHRHSIFLPFMERSKGYQLV